MHLIEEDMHRHGRRNDAGHRANGPVFMTGSKANLPTGRQSQGQLRGGRPTLVHQGSDDGPAHGSGHIRPSNGWPRMQYDAPVHAWQHLTG